MVEAELEWLQKHTEDWTPSASCHVTFWHHVEGYLETVGPLGEQLGTDSHQEQLGSEAGIPLLWI